MRRCSYCGGTGHNRATCPEFKKNNPRAFEHLAEVKKRNAQYRAAQGGRKCSYCGERGHNRRGCPEFKRDYEAAVQGLRAFREDFVRYAKANGYGIGAMVRLVAGGDDPAGTEGTMRASWRRTDDARKERFHASEVIKEMGSDVGMIVGFESENIRPQALSASRRADGECGASISQWRRPGTQVLKVIFPDGRTIPLPLGSEFDKSSMRFSLGVELVMPEFETDWSRVMDNFKPEKKLIDEHLVDAHRPGAILRSFM